jgi:sensor histidine kinase YesM
MRFIFFLFIIGLILQNNVFGQKYIRLDNIVKKDFSCVYDIEFIGPNNCVLATNNGIFLFDGVMIEPYLPIDKLPSTEVLSMFLDSKKRLWFNFFNGSIGYIKIDSLDQKNLKIVHKDTQPFNNIYEWKDAIYFSYFRKISEYNGNTQKFKTINIPENETSFPLYLKDSIAILTKGKIKTLSPHFSDYNHIILEKVKIGKTNKLTQLNKIRCIHINEKSFITLINTQLTLYTDTLVKTLNFKSKGIKHEFLIAFEYNKKTNTAFCGGYNTGLFKIKNPFSENPEISTLIPDFSIATLKLDHFDNLFVGTSNQGLFIIPSSGTLLNEINFSKEKFLINSNFGLNKFKNFYLASDEYCNFQLFDDRLNTILNGTFNNSKNNFGTTRCFVTKNNYLYLGTDLGFFKINIKTKRKQFFALNSVKTLSLTNQNKILVGSSLGLINFDLETDRSYLLLNKRIKKIAPLNDSTFYILTNDSLYKLNYFSKDKISYFENLDNFNLKGLKDLKQLSNGAVFMINNLGEIYYFEKSQVIKLHIPNPDSTNFIAIGDIYKDKIYFIHQNGIFFSYFKKTRGQYKLKGSKIINNLISLNREHINNLEILPNGNLLASYFGGLEIIPDGIDTIIDKKEKPQLYSVKYKNNIIHRYTYETNTLVFSENDLPITLTYLSPSNYSTKFFYKINSLTDFSSFDNSGFQITNLPPGEYEIQVVSDSPTENSKNVSHLKLNIKPNFYNRPIFKILLSLLIFSILIGIAFYLYEIKESKLRVEFDKKLMLHENNKLKLDILRTQMNPHFNFNALQTVIRVLQKGELSTGTEYLFKISKLQRRILESTKREFIEINEEIEILNLYLDIEMARFSKKLTIDFHVDEDLDEDTQEIPPMIVQPLIENAIWHGLSDDRVTNKKLTISFKANRNQLIVSVSDNGLGMDLKNMNNRSENSNHNSIGIKNIIQRIENLNSTVKKYSFSLNFASSMDVGSSGTTVTYIQTFRT